MVTQAIIPLAGLGTRLLPLSSVIPKELLPINESCSYHPASPYAISKVGTDLFAKYYHEAFGLKVLTTRMFTHTGPRRGDVFAESSFAKQIALIELN